MWQHILAIVTVVLIVGWGVYRSVRYFRRKDRGCGCGGCGKPGVNRKKK